MVRKLKKNQANARIKSIKGQGRKLLKIQDKYFCENIDFIDKHEIEKTESLGL